MTALPSPFPRQALGVRWGIHQRLARRAVPGDAHDMERVAATVRDPALQGAAFNVAMNVRNSTSTSTVSVIEEQGVIAGFTTYGDAITELGLVIVDSTLSNRCLGKSLCAVILDHAFATTPSAVITVQVYMTSEWGAPLVRGLGFEQDPPRYDAAPSPRRLRIKRWLAVSGSAWPTWFV